MRGINAAVYLLLAVGGGIYVAAGRKKELTQTGHFLREHGYLLLLLFAFNSISFLLTFQTGGQEIYIRKDGYGGRERQEELRLETEGQEEQFSLLVHPRTLTDEECRRKWQEAFAYLDAHLQGENASLKQVRLPLDAGLDREEFPFDVELCPADYQLLDSEGVPKNRREQLISQGYGLGEVEAGIPTSVTVCLWYGEVCEKKEYAVMILPQQENALSQRFGKVREHLQKLEREALYEEGFSLPAEVEGVRLSRSGESGVSALGVLAFGGILAVLLVLREQEDRKKREKAEREALLLCYPWFVNELMLLLGAGMQVKNIFRLLIEEHEADGPSYRNGLIRELRIAHHGMQLGMSEEQAYYQLGRRLKLACYVKLMLLLQQNVRKGGKGLTAAFEQEELAALEERKNLARRYGEEAGTKLLGPMVLLLAVVMAMIMVPAFQSLK